MGAVYCEKGCDFLSKRLSKAEFSEISDNIEALAKKQAEEYRQMFDSAGIILKYTVKQSPREYYDKKGEKLYCIEYTLHGAPHEALKPDNSKTFCRYLYKYKKNGDTYIFKQKKDFLFDFIMKSYLKSAQRLGADKFLKERPADFFLRLLFPRRCGNLGNTFKGKDLSVIRIALIVIISTAIVAFCGYKSRALTDNFFDL